MAAIMTYIKNAFATHTNRKVGFIAGAALGAAMLIFGFIQTLFIIMCGVIGLYIGARFDDGDDLIHRTLKALEEVLPERFQRW